jgi:hypothetical protein
MYRAYRRSGTRIRGEMTLIRTILNGDKRTTSKKEMNNDTAQPDEVPEKDS